ncbi:MAG: 5-formyltetrahydrofolate cyclo-ligase [Actinomycetota bacterium]
MATEKRELRRKYRQQRATIFQPKSFTNIVKESEFSGAKCVTSYFSINDEPATSDLNLLLISLGITLLLPRALNGNLEWVSWKGDRELLEENRGLIEPIGEPITDLSNIGVVIVPALHVDRLGYRLGQGGGYYDRTLPKIPGWKIGLVHSGEFGDDELPREAHDVKLDAVATPEIIHRFI